MKTDIKKNERIAYCVYSTNNYGIFKSLVGNRAIKDNRVEKIGKSIDEIGWLRNPILVNEKMEIIDGQGRFEALKKRGMMIEYIIDEGLGVDECQKMNLYQSNWTLSDFIKSQSLRGNHNYIRLEALLEKYKNVSNIAIYYSALNASSLGKTQKAPQKIIASGELVLDQDGYEKAKKELSYIDSMEYYIQNVAGRIDLIEMAFAFIYRRYPENVSSRLRDCIEKYHSTINPIATVENAFRELERVYNYRCRYKLMNFANDYKEEMRDISKRSRMNRNERSHRRKIT